MFKNDGTRISASMEQQYRKPSLYVEFTFFKNPKNSMKFWLYGGGEGIQAIKDTKYDNM